MNDDDDLNDYIRKIFEVKNNEMSNQNNYNRKLTNKELIEYFKENVKKEKDNEDYLKDFTVYKNVQQYINYLLRHYDSDIVQILKDLYNYNIPEKFSNKAMILDPKGLTKSSDLQIFKNRIISSKIGDKETTGNINEDVLLNILTENYLIKSKEELHTYVLLFKPSSYITIRHLHDIDFCIEFIKKHPYESYILKTLKEVKNNSSFKKAVNKLKLENKFVALEDEHLF